jgi:pimeloyl-ACP methyl ester carboxylesterase
VPAAATSDASVVDYLLSGGGPGVVLIHGTASDAQLNWAPVVAALADRFTVLTPNMPGSGATPDPGRPVSLASVADQVLAAADHAGLQQFELAGYSLGAAVATQLAASHPDRVRSLLLIAGWVRTDPAMAFQLDLWRRLFLADHELFTRFVLHTGMSAAFFERLEEAALAGVVSLFASSLPTGTVRQVELDLSVDLTAELASITARTQVIGLSDDRIVPIAHARALAGAIAGADFHEIDAGHLLPWEQPERFLSAIEQFLS